jgi:hypothetical protein
MLEIRSYYPINRGRANTCGMLFDEILTIFGKGLDTHRTVMPPKIFQDERA